MKSQDTQRILAKLIPLVSLYIVLGACSGGSSSTSVDPVPRQGREQVVYAITKTDSFPSLSALGTRAVFVSKRDGLDRIYKVESKLGSGAKSVPLMKDGESANGARLPESRAWISPDGTYVLVRVENGNFGLSKNTLYWVDFATGKDPVKVEDADGVFSSVVFSKDSKFFAFTTTTGAPTDLSQSATVVDASDFKIRKDMDKNEQTAFFLKDAPYGLVTLEKSPLGSTQFFNVQFTDSTFNLSVSNWGAASTQRFLTDTETFLSRGLSRAYVVEDVSSANEYRVASGNAAALSGTPGKNVQTLVMSKIAYFDLNGKSLKREGWSDFGYSVKSVSFSSADEVGVFVSQWQFKCKDLKSGADLAGVSGAGIFLANPSDAKPQLLLPVYDQKAKTWSVDSKSLTETNNVCLVADTKQVDMTPYAAVMNANATKTEFRLIYSSQFMSNSQLFFLDQTAKGLVVTPIQ